ncbi:Acyl-coenzyme A thioesterase 9, mitochondrial [Kappamyces sp. JEL0829]|nr:Acyl-coenzyme A thioesterase 9, mitochondrial [Kappamyces sp. JEL0829]
MRDSYVQDILPFQSNPQIMGRYKTTAGGVRIGRILEDLDALAGCISIAHAFGAGSRDTLQVVTASLDRIDLRRDFPLDKDVKIAGHVTWVGSSSMEVSVCVQECEGKGSPNESLANHDPSSGYDAEVKKENIIATATFIMVALDRNTGKAIPVPKLILESAKERELFERGEEAKARKNVARQFSLSKTPPNVEEMMTIHNIFLQSLGRDSLPENAIWMEDTKQATLVLTHPQDRNLYNKIFGGYLMRLAYELAYATALVATKSESVAFLAMDDITFRKPVSIGSILSIHSRIEYCPGALDNKFMVSVVANVLDPSTGTLETTNDFHFTFAAEHALPRVLPKSYEEAIAYIDGSRRIRRHLKSKK